MIHLQEQKDSTTESYIETSVDTAANVAVAERRVKNKCIQWLHGKFAP